MERHHIFYSITSPVLVAGVPFNYAIFIFGLAAILQLYVGAFVGIAATGTILLFCLALFLLGIFLTRKDKNWFEILFLSFKSSPATFFVKRVKYVA